MAVAQVCPVKRFKRRLPLYVALVGVLTAAAVFWLQARRNVVQYVYVPSPNCDDRPPDARVNCIVLHATAAESIQETLHCFLDPNARRSAHFVVDERGQVVQMVRARRRAWHAGASELNGVPDVNAYSVGIELVNRNDGKEPYSDAQYQAVADIVRQLRARYVIPESRIVPHAQVALPPGRKSDPLGFDFEKLRQALR